MRRFLLVFLSCLALLLFSVSCGGGWIVDDALKTTITFDGNGATSGEMEAQEVGKGIPTGLNANVFQRPDLPFRCWNTAADGSGTQYTEGQLVSLNSDITLYAQWGTTITENTTSWTDGNRYVLDSNVTISDQISVTGNVTLVLRDGCILTASEGIGVNEGNSLTIEAEGAGTGELFATGAKWCAGIGGGYYSSVGTITINGGIVNATGGEKAAGIGGGYLSIGNTGKITINGGTVTAKGGLNGAGIGTGNSTLLITLVINDGTVTATGGEGGAGIGGGKGIEGIYVTINGGTVVATGGSNSYFGMGIGKGFGGYSNGTLILGQGVAMQVSDDNTNWSGYNGTTRTRYMKTK